MADLTREQMAAKLRAEPFVRSGKTATALSDPVADTPMVVTLDELRPYDLNPRVTRNPLYEDIKASIRSRGLDSPPAITRRPGDAHYIIRSGGNTRLAILKELWAETKDERFFRIPCLFRPWSARGEIVALTGHLAENELHGGLTFIERALGVEKARTLYEEEADGELSQSELARRLTEDGYPITQPHISRMQDAVRYLLPAIPSILYAGLGKPQIERLATLRKGAGRAWEHHITGKPVTIDFPTLFQEVLAGFDIAPAEFNVQRARDELIGQMATHLGVDYDALALAIVDGEADQRALSRELVLASAPTPSAEDAGRTSSALRPASPASAQGTRSGALAAPTATRTPPGTDTPSATVTPLVTGNPAATARHPGTATQLAHPVPHRTAPSPSGNPPGSTSTPTESARSAAENAEHRARIEGHIVSPATTTERLEALQRTIASATGEPAPDFEANVVRAIPVQAGGLYPVSDVWYIEPAIDATAPLRVHIAQLAREIADEAHLAHRIESIDGGVGFICLGARRTRDEPAGFLARAVLSLLSALSAGYVTPARPAIDAVRLADDLAILLQGRCTRDSDTGPDRLSDAGLVKLFRLIRLARRLIELDAHAAGTRTAGPGAAGSGQDGAGAATPPALPSQS